MARWSCVFSTLSAVTKKGVGVEVSVQTDRKKKKRVSSF